MILVGSNRGRPTLFFRNFSCLCLFIKHEWKIIKSGFGYKKDREKSKAFMIWVHRPSLNDHYDHKSFKQF